MRVYLTFGSALLVAACSGSGGNGFSGSDSGNPNGGNDAGGDTSFPQNDSGTILTGDGGTMPDTGMVTSMTTIYANTDDTLYSMDPATKMPTMIGKFAGTGDSSTNSTVTDVAVNAAGDVYACTESVIYKAALPAGGTGTVQLTSVATIATAANQRFYALAFAPMGVLGTGETLVGGDGNGELYSIDAGSGATKHLGNFGADPATAGNVYALSGDIVFYMDANNKPTGLATIRSCKSGTTTCTKNNDYLAGIDMTALATAYSSGTPATSLLSGIYGGGTGTAGPGTGFGELFGLGAWEGNVYAFSRNIAAGTGTTAQPPQLISIDAMTGRGTSAASGFSFTNGWSGAGVTTKVTVTVMPPPPIK
jgi:hypothetical protein